MNTFKALIIDDEKENIDLIKIYLNKYIKSIITIYTATNVEDATSIYLEHNPDFFFLDIQLGNNQTSFAFIESINNFKGELIFISSHDNYGLKAIKINALGYILKPVKVTELVKVVNLAIDTINNKRLIGKPISPNRNNTLKLIAIPSLNTIDVIHQKEIVYLEADGRYTIFYLSNGSTKSASRNIGEYEKLLDTKTFFRIHYGFIVNLNMVTSINKSAGNYCELLNGKRLPIAKRRLNALNRFLKIK